ncbi:hypothetical protein Tco_0868712 [Tanacetum coccineum]
MSYCDVSMPGKSYTSKRPVSKDNLKPYLEEYIKAHGKKKARKYCGKVFNWQSATNGNIKVDDGLYDLRSMEAEFPAIVINDDFAPQDTLQ